MLQARITGLSVVETQCPALFGPRQRQAHPLQAHGGQVDRVPAIENRLDDVGGEKGERQETANVSLIDTVTLDQVSNRLCQINWA